MDILKNSKPISILRIHAMLPNYYESTDVHPHSKDTMSPILYNDMDYSIHRFHTFANFRNYHKFSSPLNGETTSP
jgi:hypothetical protein